MKVARPTREESRQHYDAKREPSATDIAWAAGVYEGEGSCHRKLGGSGIRVDIPQKHPEMLYRLKEFFGGGVALHHHGNAEIFTWRLSGQRVPRFLASIYPYMTSRRKQQIDNAMNGPSEEEKLIAARSRKPASDEQRLANRDRSARYRVRRREEFNAYQNQYYHDHIENMRAKHREYTRQARARRKAEQKLTE
jgi:hypothetical protein